MSLMACPLKIAAYEHPHNIALVAEGIYWDFEQWEEYVNGICCHLRKEGLSVGQKVAICAPNSVIYVSVMLAIWRLRAIAVPLSTRWPEEKKTAVVLDLQADYVWDEAALQRIHQASLQEEKTYVGVPLDDTEFNTIVYTSGSNGEPKGVVHAWRSHYYSALAVNERLDYDEESGWALSLPLYHIGGLALVFRSLLAAATLVVPAVSQSLSDLVAMDEVSHISLVPTQLSRLIDDESASAALAQLYAVVVGGSSVSQSLLDRAKHAEISVHTTYGLTEMASQVTTSTNDVEHEHLNHSGEIIDYAEVLILDDGEICVKGEALFRGYWTADGVQRVFDEEGWFHTGDLGLWLKEDELVVKGRKDRMFISGGENIYPEEIEQALLMIKGIEQAYVVAIEDAEFGQRPVAVIKTSDVLDEERYKSSLAEIIEAFKIPDQFVAWPDEMNGDVKVSRQLMEMYLEGS